MLAPVIASVVVVATPAPSAQIQANVRLYALDIRSGPLDGALQELARQTGAELLFDRTLLRGLQAPRLRGRMTIEAALRALLQDSDLALHRAASGAWLVARRPTPVAPPPEELAEPEILVIGRRTHNIDLRRRENDIQPYQVASRTEIVNAHRDNVEQFFRSRVTANTQINPASLSQNGETNSLIDLRGLGTDQTLILLDGRRLPGAPREPMTFQQPDLNAVPLHAIERVETLTGTAGGIYGFGALGGVVNVILRRDLHGVELHGTTGISTRGDARRLRLEGGIGFSPDGGDTELTLYLSQSWDQAVTEGQRDYALRGRELAAQFLPDEVNGQHAPVSGNAINVFAYDLDSETLVLRPAYGGASLGSNRTFLPRGFDGSRGDLVAALTGNAGQTDITPSAETRASDIGSTPTTTSAIFSLRHRFGDSVEAYLDGLMLRNRGRFRGYTSNGTLLLRPDDPANPFANLVLVTFPAPPARQDVKTEYASDRFTAGVVFPLTRGWKATTDATFGTVRYGGEGSKAGYLSSLLGATALNPFDDWARFQSALADNLLSTAARFDSHNRYREQSLRLAGPLFRTEAGRATLTLLAQNRTETVPGYTLRNDPGRDDVDPSYTRYGDHGSDTRSFSAELDAPLIADTAATPLLKGLALQLAVRRDDQSVRFYADPEQTADRLRARFIGTAFTAGARLLPLSWLMLRGSYATGQQPPPLDDLIAYDLSSPRAILADPKRGNAPFTDPGSYLDRIGGSPDLKTIRAGTLAMGLVFNPRGETGPRISLDYSRIRRTRDPVTLDAAYVLANEDRWPERVARLPLSDADRARGYTGGLISLLDTRAANLGTFVAESIDTRLDWALPWAGGMVRVNGAASFQIHNLASSPADPTKELAGYQGGPLRWRINGGLEWAIGQATLGANAQYFSRYRVLDSNIADECCSTGIEVLQGSQFVKAQTYLDLYASRRFRLDWAGKMREFSLDLGLVNLLDTAPPYLARLRLIGPMFSPYGDIRQRRLELSFNANF